MKKYMIYLSLNGVTHKALKHSLSDKKLAEAWLSDLKTREMEYGGFHYIKELSPQDADY